MTRQRAPEVTDAEVLDFLADDSYARTAPEIASHIWWARGGQGNPADATRNGNQPRVPVVRASNVRPVLDRLVQREEVVQAKGSEVNEVGSPYEGYRETYTYYTTTAHANAHRARLAQRRAEATRDRSAAEILATVFAGHVLRAEVGNPGYVRVVFSTEQAEQWCRRISSHFAPDEVDALVITAADAVHGDPDALSERQRDLAEQAHNLHTADNGEPT